MNIINMGAGIADNGILISPYFDGFTSLESLKLPNNRLLDIDNINIPPSVQFWGIRYNLLTSVPNMLSHRPRALEVLYLDNNDITHVSDAILVGMSRTISTRWLHNNKLVELGDVTVLNNLNNLKLHGNELETIPDMLGGLPQLYVLTIQKTRGWLVTIKCVGDDCGAEFGQRLSWMMSSAWLHRLPVAPFTNMV